MILCNDLHKQFGDVEAVKGVSMEIPDGRFLGLLGPSWGFWARTGLERQR